MKPRLRDGSADQFYIQNVGWPRGHDNHRYQWARAPVMNWRDILSELVGYTKYAESRVPDEKKPKSVLTEMHDYCTAEKERMKPQLIQRIHARQESIVTFGENNPQGKTEGKTAKKQAKLRLLHSRMQSLINT